MNKIASPSENNLITSFTRVNGHDVHEKANSFTSSHEKREYISPYIKQNKNKIRSIKIETSDNIEKIKQKKPSSSSDSMHDKEKTCEIEKICTQADNKINQLETENKIYHFRDRYKALLQDNLLTSITQNRDKKSLSKKEDALLNEYVENRCDKVTDYVIDNLYGDKVVKKNTDFAKKALFFSAATVPLDMLQFVAGSRGGPASAVSLGGDILSTEFNMAHNVVNPNKSFKRHTKDWVNRQMFTLVLVPPLLGMEALHLKSPAVAIGLGAAGYGVSQVVRSQLPKFVDKYISPTDSLYKVR